MIDVLLKAKQTSKSNFSAEEFFIFLVDTRSLLLAAPVLLECFLGMAVGGRWILTMFDGLHTCLLPREPNVSRFLKHLKVVSAT